MSPKLFLHGDGTDRLDAFVALHDLVSGSTVSFIREVAAVLGAVTHPRQRDTPGEKYIEHAGCWSCFVLTERRGWIFRTPYIS